MGVVYRALDTRLERTVALKVLRPETVGDPERKWRFIREAKAASALNHPHIVTIHDVDADQGVDFMVMEYVEGTPLNRLIPAGGLPVRDAVDIAARIASALGAAHAAGIVHRDVKPANVVVGPGGRVKVLDFGLAKLVERGSGPDDMTSDSTATAASIVERTREGVILGTVAYMSPEQAEGKPLDARSDVFSLGAVMHEMLTGRRPFQGDSYLRTLTAILRDAPPPLAAVRPDVPAALEKIVTRCAREAAGGPLRDRRRRREGARRARRRLGRGRIARGLSGNAASPLWQLVLCSRWPESAAWRIVRSVARQARAREDAARDRAPRRAAEDSWRPPSRAGGREDAAGGGRAAREKLVRVHGHGPTRRAPRRLSRTIPRATPAGCRRGRRRSRGIHLPLAHYRWRFTLPGHQTVEGTIEGFAEVFRLDPVAAVPPGMVRVPGGPFSLRSLRVRDARRVLPGPDRGHEPPVQGVRGRRGIREARVLEAALRQGRPDALVRRGGRRLPRRDGPAGARNVGARDVPGGPRGLPGERRVLVRGRGVCGVRGKSLPTVYHWYHATGNGNFSDILRAVQLRRKRARARREPTRAWARTGRTTWRETSRSGAGTSSAGRRYLLGGAFSDAVYAVLRARRPDPVRPLAPERVPLRPVRRAPARRAAPRGPRPRARLLEGEARDGRRVPRLSRASTRTTRARST